MVLPLHGAGSASRHEGKRLVFDDSICGDDNVLSAWWSLVRRRGPPLWAAHGPGSAVVCRTRAVRRAPDCGLARSESDTGRIDTGSRGRCPLHLAEFLLVCDCGYRRQECWRCFFNNEYGCPGGRRCDNNAHSLAGGEVWMVGRISRCGIACLCRGIRVAGSEPRDSTLSLSPSPESAVDTMSQAR